MEQIGFEQQVKNVASRLWPEAIGGGSEVIEGKERDGVYITDDAVQLIECTISKTKEKAEKDIGKLSSLVKQMQKKYPDKAVKGWFITLEEPTADQRAVANNQGYLVFACSFDKFQSKLINVPDYFSCRANYPFGSVRDPKTGEIKVLDEYVDTDLIDIINENNVLDIKKIADQVLHGKRICVIGFYGVGKSMALKEVYKIQQRSYNSKYTVKFPVYLNLRDHHGQTSAVEAIERHARNIGFGHPEHLVRAWRAGFVNLILDGYDEIAVFGWTGKSSTLKDIRYKSMELIRDFIKNNPSNGGILLAGRRNYFDSIREGERALNLSTKDLIVRIGDFSTDQVKKYLNKKGLNSNIPPWIPTRPLLLGYLAAKGILTETAGSNGMVEPAEGWNYLLEEISKREASIEAGLSADTIREIIEGISGIARAFQNGLGPIYQNDLEKVFKDKCGYPPDDRALVLLQRLPGLIPQDEQDGSRYFIDQVFASIAKAGDIFYYVVNPYDYKFASDPRNWQESLDEDGVQMLTYRLGNLESSIVEESIVQAKKIGADVLAVDLLMTLNYSGKPWTRERITFQNVLIPTFEIKKEVDWSRIQFYETIFRELSVEELPELDTSPTFKSCIIGTMIGCSNVEMIAKEIIDESTVDNYEIAETTTTAILNLDIPIPAKVGLTILKKLYLQSGGGRQENSFYRGLTSNEQAYIPNILEYFKHADIAIMSKRSGSNTVWQPVRSQTNRIRQILINKNYKDEIMSNLKRITN
jgi:hypothetical protein